ncbi:MAG: N-acetylneuraminate synthase [Rhodospirillaceae bacterium]|jgi:sialic acid synthase SpsE|nr:N-acetylneuraminate synthase [Rhodospirillaceae bacterium]MBT5667362.1 N-acetylneuraminate synthase [Rhodospirillaceae bacterium]MBT5810925.1 N-acetylneuraminate synthase [Rhodospirillaceae bacterium]
MKFQENQATFVIAEIGANHNGDMEIAKKMIDCAKECGADAVKFQSWDASLFSKQVYEENKFLGDDYRDRNDYTLREIMDKFSVSYAQMEDLKAYCKDVGIIFSSTPFSAKEFSEIEKLGAPYIKIASMDLVNPEILEAAGAVRLPILLSTGFSELSEIEQAVRIIEDGGNDQLVILHCNGLYPPDDHEVNLNNMAMLRAAFGYPVGFSDHTIGVEMSIASIALGATVLEKHFTLDKQMFGWDHAVSADPPEMAMICSAAKKIHAGLGQSRRQISPRELERRTSYRRSIVAACDIKAGQAIGRGDITFRRPGHGIAPMQYHTVVGKIAASDIANDTIIAQESLITPPGEDAKK